MQKKPTPARALAAAIEKFPASQPISDNLRSAFGYRCQKEHWLGWLSEYDGPGYYGRAVGRPYTMRDIYNRINCYAMLVWLAEAVGVDMDLVLRAALESETHKNSATAAGAARKFLPWFLIEQKLKEHGVEA